jgi:hypothetical protein
MSGMPVGMRSAALALLMLLIAPCAFAQTGVRGGAESIAAAQRLLAQAGGAEAWRARTFDVVERVYLSDGMAGEMRIVRDFESRTRRLDRTTPTGTLTEWVSPSGGWVRRDGVVTPMSASELSAELHGLQQEPYAIYHRLAHNDSSLRVELRENGALHVFDGEERLLCWFQLAPNGVLLGWGNFYNGAINQHHYGPVADMGDANLPRFGVASDGRFRFEYVSASLRPEPMPTSDSRG